MARRQGWVTERWQTRRGRLFLAPGDYVLSGRVRPDKLQARRGLQWRVHCSAGPSVVLGQSGEFAGTGDWREFSFPVSVPPECNGQVLRLFSVGQRDVDHELSGAIWFDDLALELQR